MSQSMILGGYAAAVRAGGVLSLVSFVWMPSNAANLSLAPSDASIQVGEIVSFDLVVSGLGDGTAPSLGAFDLDFTFPSALLKFQGVSFGSVLEEAGSTLGIDRGFSHATASDLVNLFWVSIQLPEDLDAQQPGTFTLTTLSFRAIAEGVGPLGVGINAFGDGFGEVLAMDEMAPGSVVVQGRLATVPDGGSAMLLLVGGLGWVMVSRRSLGGTV